MSAVPESVLPSGSVPPFASAVDEFRGAMLGAGLTPPEEILADGVLHRFSSNGKRGDDSGWYVLHADGIAAGAFGDWRADTKQTWHARTERRLTPEEIRAHRERVEAMKSERKAEEERRHGEAAEAARKLWSSAAPAAASHPYLQRKHIQPHGARVDGDDLLVPLTAGGKIVNLQRIRPDGEKRFLPGGRTRGCLLTLGKPDGVLHIAEGYATGATVREATGHAVVIAFSASNLKPVAMALREKFPELTIVVCGDNDASGTGQRAAREAAKAVGGAVAIPPEAGRDWNDTHCAEGLDAVRAGVEAAAAENPEHEAEAGERDEVPLEAYGDDSDTHADGDTERNSQASLLVGFVRSRCRLVHDENGDVYAIENATKEVRNIERRSFRTWLHAEFYKTTTKVARAQSVSEALTTLSGIGLHDGELVEVHIRCAPLGDGYVIDLGEPGQSRAIVVRPGSWTVTKHHGVMFVRSDNTKPLPEPVGGGTLDSLWSLVNVPASSRLLVLTWLLECLRPDTPFPLLEAIGEHGSAKTGLQRLLKRLIDPSAIELRSAPRSGEDVFVGAGQGWLLAYDNVSHLSADLQDVLCRVATGASFATRKLYTNGEEFSIRAKRPMSINGIGAAVTAQDLVDRAVSLELETITDRREAAAVEAEFDRLHPALLAALLDLFAKALAELPAVDIERDRRPRLIEFAKLGCAVAKALGRTAEDFMSAFESMKSEAVSRTIDASPVATALLEYLEDRPDRHREYTVKGLFESLTRPDGGEAWPRSPKGFADALRRAAPALRTFGVLVKFAGNRGGHARVTVSRKYSPAQSHASHASHAADGSGSPEHDMHDIHDFNPASFSGNAADNEVVL
jgi:phage/plasmid primase-like uncharacterized protein